MHCFNVGKEQLAHMLLTYCITVVVINPYNPKGMIFTTQPVMVRNIDKLSLSIQECKSIGVELTKEILKKLMLKKR